MKRAFVVFPEPLGPIIMIAWLAKVDNIFLYAECTIA